MAYVFFGTAITYREVYLVEGMIVFGLFVIMLYSLYLTKQDPGSIRQDVATDPYMRILTYHAKGRQNPKTRYPSGRSPSINMCK